MNDIVAQVSVRILDKEYQFQCAANERTDLLDSAEAVNAEMRKIREGGKVVGLDRIAVLAALRMANELLHAKARDDAMEGTIGDRLKVLAERVETVLGNSGQLDL